MALCGDLSAYILYSAISHIVSLPRFDDNLHRPVLNESCHWFDIVLLLG